MGCCGYCSAVGWVVVLIVVLWDGLLWLLLCCGMGCGYCSAVGWVVVLWGGLLWLL